MAGAGVAVLGSRRKGSFAGEEEFRRTDRDLRARKVRPSSPFKLVGASQVGKGSLRGMPCLARLEEAGFHVWPFRAGPPLVIEIYPALLTTSAVKSSPRDIAAASAGSIPAGRPGGRDEPPTHKSRAGAVAGYR